MEQWNEIDCHGCGRQFCLFICCLIINKYKERVSFDLDNREREDGDPDSDEENYNGEDSREIFFLSLLETACLFLERSERWNQNICIDAGDVDLAEDAAMRTEAEHLEDREARQELNEMMGSVAGGDALVGQDAATKVEESREKMGKIFDMWLLNRSREQIPMEELEDIYGASAFPLAASSR